MIPLKRHFRCRNKKKNIFNIKILLNLICILGVPSTSVWEQYDSSTKMNLHITNDENEILTIMDEIKVPAYSQAQIAFWKTLEVTGKSDDCLNTVCDILYVAFFVEIFVFAKN
jgi:hypothetical protein